MMHRRFPLQWAVIMPRTYSSSLNVYSVNHTDMDNRAFPQMYEGLVSHDYLG